MWLGVEKGGQPKCSMGRFISILIDGEGLKTKLGVEYGEGRFD